MAAFILAVMMNDYKPGQVSVLIVNIACTHIVQSSLCTVYSL